MGDASRIAPNVFAAFFGTGKYQRFYRQSSAPAQMEIGNFEQKQNDSTK